MTTEKPPPFFSSFLNLVVGVFLLLMMFIGLAAICMVALEYPVFWVCVAGIALWAWWWVNKPKF